MMRTILAAVLPLLSVLASVCAGEVVECHPVATPDAGGFPDMTGMIAHPIARLVRQEAPSDDFAASFRCGWDRRNLYIEVSVTDDRLIPADRSRSWQNDLIEVYLDYTGRREKQNQFHWFPVLDKTGEPAFFSVADGRDLSAVGVRAVTERTSGGYLARLAIPLEFFLEEGGVTIGDGSAIGFDLCVNNLADTSREQIRHRFWSGDGSNWQSAAANGRMVFVGQEAASADRDGFRPTMADRYGLALWPELSLLTGNSRLLATRQSARSDSYRPFGFGALETALDTAAAPRSEFAHGALGACSLGEHLENGRFLYHEIYAGDHHLTRITGVMHPARMFRTDSDFVRLFAGAGPEGTPTQLVLPDGAGVTMDRLPAAPEFRSGYVTVLFGGGEGALTMPLLVVMSQPPRELRRTESGALELYFGDAREKTIALLPLYGTRLIPAGTVPDDLGRRAEFWYRTLLAAPLDVAESFRLLPESSEVEFRWRFDYARRRDLFPNDAPIALAPQSPFFGDRLSGVEDLEMPLNSGPYRAAVGVRELTFRLPYPALPLTAALPTEAELRRWREDPLGAACLDRLNDGRFLAMVEAVVNAQLGAERPAVHVAPYWEWSRLYPFLTPENRARYRKLVRQVLDGVVFHPEAPERFYPPREYAGRNHDSYRNLTEPYGCPEPFWNLGQVLAGVGEYAYYTGDYEVIKAHWPLIQEMARIAYLGGFAHYRYDGGRTLAAVFEGLIRGAEAVGDIEYRDATIAAYAAYLNTVSSFYRQSDWAVQNRLYSQLGEAPEEFDNAILFITRQPLYTRINSGLYSGGYGCGYDSTYLVNPRVFGRAEPEIRRIEQVVLPQFRPDWTVLREWEWPESAVTRFAVRALLLNEPYADVERDYRTLREQPRIAADEMASCRLAGFYLERLRRELPSD